MNIEILEITKKFHDTYEKLASEYTYETRKETRVFDINSNNGKLMYATVNKIISPILEENQELKKQLEEADRKLFFTKNELDMRQKSIDNKLTQQKEFVKYLEDEIKLQEKINDKLLATAFEEILQKYKETIGDDK